MGRPLRVVARVHGYPPTHNAGAEWMLHTLLRALAERGHAVSVHLHRYGAMPGRYDLDGITVHPLESRTTFVDAGRDADVLIGHLEGAAAAVAFGREWSVPSVVLVHNTHPASFDDAAGRPRGLQRRVDGGRGGEHYTSAELPVPAHLVVRPPVLAVDYATTPGDRVTLVNLNESKGGALFWELAERMPDLEFLGVQGAYGDQVVPGHLPPNAVVLPQQAGAMMRDQVYARTRLLLMPSAYESWGRAGVEAMASGIPVIAHPTPGLVESLGDAYHFADRNDPDAWEKAIRRLLEPKTYAAASAAALARSAELDPAADLTAWCEAVEALAKPGEEAS
ncbi:glycosyltransferase family 4 protein [Kitasatospora gansuensis]